MLKNYLLVSLRNLKRHFTYSFVNIFGLTVGLACTLVIGLWVYQEYSYDKHFEDAENIHRIGVNFFNIGDMSVGPEILKEKLTAYSDVEHATSLSYSGRLTFLVDREEFVNKSVYVADQDYFSVFTYDFLQGDPSLAMAEPNSIVLTKETAMQLFGEIDVLDKTIELDDNSQTYRIKGVVDGSKPSHLPANAWISKDKSTTEFSWTSAGSYQYVKLKGTNTKARLNEILADQLEEIKSMFAPDQTMEEFKQSGTYTFLPMPITDIHLKSNLKFEPSTSGNDLSVKLFAGIALLILTLASINFINISTARATTRAKEVGIRKSMGTSRLDLIMQFILESVIVCLIAMTIASLAGEFILKGFEKATGLELLPTLFTSPLQFVVVFAGAIALGIVAGVYPAFYITRFKPVRVLKGLTETNEKGGLRNGLVLFQFAISISLLIVSIFIFNQLKYIENRDMGFNAENIMVIQNLGKVSEHGLYLKDELSKKSYVQTVSTNRRVPAGTNLSITEVRTDDEREVWMQVFLGDENYLECLGYRLLAGRNFSNEIITDTSAVIVNESAVAELGFTDPIGKTLSDGQFKIIGVVSDFNFESMKEKIDPVMISYSSYNDEFITIKFDGQHSDRLIDDVNTLWESINAEEELSYYFLDENFAKLVERERVLSKAIIVFTILAMFISCLGLYGLSIFTAERKTREIGIRRVLGASIRNITQLLSKNFAKPIVIAFILSIPTSYFIAKSWLENYQYRVEIVWWPFVFSGSIALLLGLITISSQSIRVALKNPVESLRTE